MGSFIICLTDKLALLQVIAFGNRQVFCVGDRFKVDKHNSWNNNSVVSPKSVESMTTKRQMKPTFSVSKTASQARENSQSNVPEHTLVSSILNYSDLIFRRNCTEEQHFRPIIEPEKLPNLSNALPNSKSIQEHHKLQHKFLNFEFLLVG